MGNEVIFRGKGQTTLYGYPKIVKTLISGRVLT
jgi:hypothetical protein